MKSEVTTVEHVVDGANNAPTVRGSNNTNNRSTTEQLHTPFSVGLYTRAGESSAPPQKSPHLSDESVDLLLLEEDKYTVLGEVHRLETVSLVVQVQGLRPNRSELRHILYATFSEEMANILDIQFMSRGCYHVEFADEDSVSKL